jgi:hypothetical protein
LQTDQVATPRQSAALPTKAATQAPKKGALRGDEASALLRLQQPPTPALQRDALRVVTDARAKAADEGGNRIESPQLLRLVRSRFVPRRGELHAEGFAIAAKDVVHPLVLIRPRGCLAQGFESPMAHDVPWLTGELVAGPRRLEPHLPPRPAVPRASNLASVAELIQRGKRYLAVGFAASEHVDRRMAAARDCEWLHCKGANGYESLRMAAE